MELLSAQSDKEVMVADPQKTCRKKKKEERKSSGGLRRRGVSRRRWTPLEDAKLCEQVAIHGSTFKWKMISKELPGRSRNSCRFRWVKLSKANVEEISERGSESGQSIVYGSNYNISRIHVGRSEQNKMVVDHHISSPPPFIDFLGLKYG